VGDGEIVLEVQVLELEAVDVFGETRPITRFYWCYLGQDHWMQVDGHGRTPQDALFERLSRWAREHPEIDVIREVWETNNFLSVLQESFSPRG
jgi:hypothetical protein